jgi:hypothetical protein
MIAFILQVLGLALLIVGGFLCSPAAGIVACGIVAFVSGLALEGKGDA